MFCCPEAGFPSCFPEPRLPHLQNGSKGLCLAWFPGLSRSLSERAVGVSVVQILEADIAVPCLSNLYKRSSSVGFPGLQPSALLQATGPSSPAPLARPWL
jgi:hypothetical protein